MKAIYWHLTRRKVRAGNVLRDATRGLPVAYSIWLETHEQLLIDRASDLERAPGAPKFDVHILLDEGEPSHLTRLSRRSVEAQTYPAVSVRSCSAAELVSKCGQMEGDYVVFLKGGDRLAKSALLQLAERIIRDRPAMLYGDEDWPANHRWERQPWFKPDWNAELFLGLDYLSSLIVVRRDVLGEILDQGNDGSTFDDLLLRLTGMVSPDIAHLPSVLSHVGTACPPKAARLRAVAGHLDGRAECRPGPFDTVHVQWPLPSPPPLATIIIPTRDKIELLRACVESIFEKTDYAAYEIIIVDNGSRENATLAYLEQLTRDPNVRVIRSDAEYNFSALNNLAVRAAAGSFVLLLNNDTEVISPEWLSELMRQAVREEVGAVGAKLLYEDDSIQHAGVVVGMGEAAGHAHRFLASHDPGYFWQAHVAQFVTANTAACLLVRRDKFEAVGGLDEEGLAIAYNDVDLCLKLERAGWRNVYTPHALLYHHESKSRGNDLSPEHRDRYMRELKVFQERWGTRTYLDPQHSPNLDRYSESYVTNFY